MRVVELFGVLGAAELDELGLLLKAIEGGNRLVGDLVIGGEGDGRRGRWGTGQSCGADIYMSVWRGEGQP